MGRGHTSGVSAYLVQRHSSRQPSHASSRCASPPTAGAGRPPHPPASQAPPAPQTPHTPSTRCLPGGCLKPPMGQWVQQQRGTGGRGTQARGSDACMMTPWGLHFSFLSLLRKPCPQAVIHLVCNVCWTMSCIIFLWHVNKQPWQHPARPLWIGTKGYMWLVLFNPQR